MEHELPRVFRRAPEAERHWELCLEVLRLRLQRYARRRADRLVGQAEAYTDQLVGPSELRRVWGLGQDEAGQRWLDKLGVPPLDLLEARLAERRRTLATFVGEASERGVRLPLEELQAAFGLDNWELEFLIAAAAPSVSVDWSRLYPVLFADFSQKVPTVGFLLEVLGVEGEVLPSDPLGEGSRLVRHRLLAWAKPQDQAAPSRLHAGVCVPQRVLDAMIGLGRGGLAWARRVESGAKREELLLGGGQVWERLEQGLRAPRARVWLSGPVGSGRRSAVAAVLRGWEQPLLEVDLRELLEGATTVQREERWFEVLREGLLLRACLLLRADHLDDEQEAWMAGRAGAWRRALETHPERVVLCVSGERGWSAWFPTQALHVPLAPLGREARSKLWEAALPARLEGGRGALAGELAGRYPLSPGEIARVGQSLREAARHGRWDHERLVAEVDALIRRRLEHRLASLAELVDTQVGIEELVLTEEGRRKLGDILAHARHRERVYQELGMRRYGLPGLSVLFNGPPGTGKTLTAGVLSRQLGRPLYRVDLSRVVDKYIGETEKNLGRIFQEALRADAIILFDEADALFGKRTEAKDATDRYANLEVNYLLQRMEQYDGVTILTTNFPKGIDEAFQRRIKFHVEFPLPDAKMRGRLWESHAPPALVREEVPWERLGEVFEFSGGHIRNAVIRAVFRALDAEKGLDEGLLFEAGMEECAALGILVRQ